MERDEYYKNYKAIRSKVTTLGQIDDYLTKFFPFPEGVSNPGIIFLYKEKLQVIVGQFTQAGGKVVGDYHCEICSLHTGVVKTLASAKFRHNEKSKLKEYLHSQLKSV